MSKTKHPQTAYLERVTDSKVAIVTLDNFPVNSLHPNVSNGLTQALLDIEAMIAKDSTSVKAVVLRGKGRCFCAGADIAAFGAKNDVKPLSLGRPKSDAYGFEELPVPVVAAIHGFALGGGFELSLGCHYRVIAPNAFVGLPEVNIGLLPGAQGTQRLPRLVGAQVALELMTAGDHIPAPAALAKGVVDAIAPSADPDAVLAAAVEFALARAASGETPRRISMMAPPPATDIDAAKAKLAKKRRGEPAPLAIAECVRAASAGGAADFAAGVAVEQKLFVPLIKSPESAALRHMFFAERAGAKLEPNALGQGAGKTKPATLRTVGIVGAGLMGGGIGMSCAEAGQTVIFLDRDEDALKRGFQLIEKNYARSVSRGSKTQAFVDACRGRMSGITDVAGFADCDLVVEAVFEELEIKKKIFAQLDAVCKPGAFMCSNTSALNIDAIAAQTKRPEFVMGTHFFSPANVMKLLENVRGKHTSDLTVSTMMAWGKKIGKWPILVGNCPGFVGNRMIGFYSRGARMCVSNAAALPERVDAVSTKFGFRMGPFAMADLVGLDLGIQAWKKRGEYDPERVPDHALIESGRKGQKTNAGWFDYDEKTRASSPSPKVAAMLEQVAATNGVTREPIDDDEIERRLLFPLINEGFKILDEGMAQRPADIDVCYVHGYGFPRVRGGPMFYADQVGVATVKQTLEKMGIATAPLLEECVASGQSLAKFWATRAKKAKL